MPGLHRQLPLPTPGTRGVLGGVSPERAIIIIGHALDDCRDPATQRQ